MRRALVLWLPFLMFCAGSIALPAQAACHKDSGTNLASHSCDSIDTYLHNGTPQTVDDAGHGLPVGSTIIVSASFTTPAGTTAYSTGDLIANSATAGSVTPLDFAGACRVAGGTGLIRRARLKTPDTGFASGSVILYLYKGSPTVTNGDNGAWLSTESNYIGSIPITLDKHFSDAEKGIGVPASGSEINFDCGTGSTDIYGLEVAAGAITPQGAKLHTVVLEILAN